MVVSLYHKDGQLHVDLEEVVAIHSKTVNDKTTELCIVLACNECPVIIKTSPNDVRRFVDDYMIHHNGGKV